MENLTGDEVRFPLGKKTFRIILQLFRMVFKSLQFSKLNRFARSHFLSYENTLKLQYIIFA